MGIAFRAWRWALSAACIALPISSSRLMPTRSSNHQSSRSAPAAPRTAPSQKPRLTPPPTASDKTPAATPPTSEPLIINGSGALPAFLPWLRSCWSAMLMPARTAAPATLPPSAARIESISPMSCLPGLPRLKLDYFGIGELRQLGRSPGQDRKGRVVDRDHGLHPGQGDGPRRGGGSHGEVTTDRQHRDGRTPRPHERHIAEEVGVARVVDPSTVFELDQPAPAADLACRLRAVAGDGDAPRVHGVEHRELDACCLDCAALVHADCLHAERRQVDRELVAAHHYG